jgi:transcriptional regulator with XRE-family HTH domain
MTFGEKLIRLRKIKGITQDEFAAVVGVSRQAVYKWESEKSYPEAAKLIEIKNLFSISIDDLLDESFEIELPKKKRKKRLSDEKKRQIEEKIEKELEYGEGAREEAQDESVHTGNVLKEPALVTAKDTERTDASTSQNLEEPEKEKKVGFFGRLFGKR